MLTGLVRVVVRALALAALMPAMLVLAPVVRARVQVAMTEATRVPVVLAQVLVVLVTATRALAAPVQVPMVAVPPVPAALTKNQAAVPATPMDPAAAMRMLGAPAQLVPTVLGRLVVGVQALH